MSASDLLNYLALQDPSSGFSASVTGDANGTVLERLQYLVDNLPAGEPMPPSVHCLSPFSIGVELGSEQNPSGTPASGTWQSANRAVLVPFRVTKTVTAYRAWSYNGTAASGNLDIGIYNDAFSRLVSTGSTAQSGTTTIQDVDLADTALAPGLYYMAMAMDNTTGAVFHAQSTPRLLRAYGVVQMASAFALPSTVTPATTVGGQGDVPVFGISFRSTL